MYERIRELSKEAWTWAEQQDYTDPTVEFSDILEQKFALLIVEECRYVMDCNKGSDQHLEWNLALSETSDKIKQHFGIK